MFIVEVISLMSKCQVIPLAKSSSLCAYWRILTSGSISATKNQLSPSVSSTSVITTSSYGYYLHWKLPTSKIPQVLGVSYVSQNLSTGLLRQVIISFKKMASCLIVLTEWILSLLSSTLYYPPLLLSHIIHLSSNPWRHPQLCLLLFPSIFTPKPSKCIVSSGFTIY